MALDEFKAISLWTSDRQSSAWQGKRGVRLGLGDDSASISIRNEIDGISGEKNMLLAMDTMVETVHFNDITMADEDVGYKALAANVSDIAAMGGVPLHALVSVSVPPAYGPERMGRVYDGLYDCAARYGIAVVGGDTTSSPDKLVISVSLTGSVEAGAELRRSGAKPGDKLFLTGPVGMSAAGLHLLLKAGSGNRPVLSEEYRNLVQAHRRPSPSVRAGRLLMASGACTSLNDVSDGLASEAWELAESSGLRLVLEENRLPKSGSMASYGSRCGYSPLDWMLYGGEDYVLLGTVAESAANEAASLFRKEGLPFYLIGTAEPGEPGVQLIPAEQRGSGNAGVSAGGGGHREYRRALHKKGYNHFEK
ncbi:thiamine-phosphate kinase [Paenibacillus sp. CAU 1782]